MISARNRLARFLVLGGLVAGTLTAVVPALPAAAAGPYNVNQDFIITGAASEPFGVVVDQNYVYWANCSSGTIGRADLDGDPASVNQDFITGASCPSGIVVNGSNIYWANQTSGYIGTADLDGDPASVNQEFISTTQPIGVAIDSSYIYWTEGDGNAIGRADLDGDPASVNQNFIPDADANVPTGIAVNGSNIFWANEGGNTISEADLDGNNVNQDFITGATSPGGIVIDQNSIYWANVGSTTIGQADLDGTNVNQDFITGASAPVGVWVNSTDIYWSNSSTNTIGQASLKATPTATVANSTPTTLGSSVTFTVTVAGSSGTPTGTITWSVSGTAGVTACTTSTTTLSGGTATCTITVSTAGTYIVSGSYGGDDNYNTTPSSSDTVTVAAPSCYVGPWPTRVTGKPVVRTVNPGHSPEGFYIGVVNNGWSLTVTHPGKTSVTFSGTIQTTGTFTNVRRVKLENTDRLTLVGNNTITFTFHDSGSGDGVSFTSNCGRSVTFKNFKIAAKPAKPSQIFVGSTKSAGRSPMTFARSSS